MIGFEPGIFGVGSNRSTECATTAATFSISLFYSVSLLVLFLTFSLSLSLSIYLSLSFLFCHSPSLYFILYHILSHDLPHILSLSLYLSFFHVLFFYISFCVHLSFSPSRSSSNSFNICLFFSQGQPLRNFCDKTEQDFGRSYRAKYIEHIQSKILQSNVAESCV